ncbi:hypothetical protein ACH347_26925 [Saccharopolyspora sp. 5N102]|uniref:hypothetical protein n=1 Tax=Saccharopolyspora sp. 5N102 TaxID=3375155 RepID=UPI0037ABE617
MPVHDGHLGLDTVEAPLCNAEQADWASAERTVGSEISSTNAPPCQRAMFKRDVRSSLMHRLIGEASDCDALLPATPPASCSHAATTT